jgi:hypothetical protein
MSWDNPQRRRAVAHDKVTIEGAVAYFRDEQLQPVHADGPCPYCGERALHFQQVDVDDRIVMRIGAFRIALCLTCAAFCVVYPGRRTKQKKQQDAEKIQASRSTISDEGYQTLIRDWYRKNGW